jgi:hypothetical protein
MTADGMDCPAELFELDRATCSSLLRTQCVGRLVTAGETPRILPVNDVAVDGAIVFQAAAGPHTDGRHHWHSTTRDLVHRATRPVLVVPARPAPVRARPGPATHAAVGYDRPFFDRTVGAGAMPAFQSPLIS